MMGPEHTQAAAFPPSEARLPGQQHQQYQHGSVPVIVPQNASGDSSGPLAAAAAASCLPPSGVLHGSASTPGMAPGPQGMRLKPTIQSRSRSYSSSLQSAGVSKPAGHRGYQTLMNMANGAHAGGFVNAVPAGMACTAASGPPGMMPTAAGGNSCSLNAAALLHGQTVGMRSGLVQLAHLGSPSSAAATAAAGHGQGLSAAAMPVSSRGSPASAQPTVAQQPSGLLGWPSSSSSVSSFQQLMLSHHPAAFVDGMGHGPVCLQGAQLPVPSAAVGARNMPADGQQQQQLQQGLRPTAAVSPQASPMDVSSSKAAATALDAFAPWSSNGMTAGTEGVQSESLPPPPRQTMWQQLSMLLHMQEQHQLYEEQQRQAAAAAARASCQIQLQQQQLMIQELQQQMAELRSALMQCKNSSRRYPTHRAPA